MSHFPQNHLIDAGANLEGGTAGHKYIEPSTCELCYYVIIAVVEGDCNSGRIGNSGNVELEHRLFRSD